MLRARIAELEAMLSNPHDTRRTLAKQEAHFDAMLEKLPLYVAIMEIAEEYETTGRSLPVKLLTAELVERGIHLSIRTVERRLAELNQMAIEERQAQRKL